MHLQDIESTEEERWFPYGLDKLELRIRPMLEEEFVSLTQRSRRERWQRHQRVMEVDPNKIDAEVVRSALLDWRGMTGSLFCRMAHVKAESAAQYFGIPPEQFAKAIIPFDMDTALYLGKRCMGFADAVYDMAGQIAEEGATQTKN